MSQYGLAEGVGEIHYASTPDASLWSDEEIRAMAREALEPTALQFEAIYEEAQRRRTAAVNRVSAMIVGLKPRHTDLSTESVMFIAELDAVPRPENPDDEGLELFTLKATERAFLQAKRGVTTDLNPMHHLSWLRNAGPDERAKLHRGATASAGGIHIGIAGPWPHHSRELAATFVTSFADKMGLTFSHRVPESSTQERPEITAWRQVLEAGQGAGDNSPGSAEVRRRRYGFVLDVL